MPTWLIPVLKAIPHIGSIISAASPAFTQKQPEASIPPVLQKQIAELQTAASANAANIKELASQLQATVQALQEGAQQAELKLAKALRMCIACAGAALVAAVVAIVLVLVRT